MNECNLCHRPLNKRQVSEIGVLYCFDCIKNRSFVSKAYMKAKRDSLKKEMYIIMILAAIGAVVGTILGINGIGMETGSFVLTIIFDIWAIGGLVTGLSCCIGGFHLDRKYNTTGKIINDEPDFWGFAPSAGFLFFSVLGLFGGVIFILILILNRIKRIKKFDAIIASENAAIAEFEGYTLGKNINKEDLYSKIMDIVHNFEVADYVGGISINDLNNLRIAKGVTTRKEKRINKHIYTWVGTFLFGLFGVDRFMRGQIGLGILKFILNVMFAGVWLLIDWIIALTKLSKYGKDFVFVDTEWS